MSISDVKLWEWKVHRLFKGKKDDVFSNCFLKIIPLIASLILRKTSVKYSYRKLCESSLIFA